MSEIPWFWPGVAVSLVVGLVLGERVGRRFGSGGAIGWLLVVAIGAIVSATLTPGREALDTGATGGGVCDLRRWGPAGLSDLLAIPETGLNVLLFVPLGAVIGLLPGQRRAALLAGAAVLMPIAIEAIQLVAVPFDRACESADIIDNLTGIGVGFMVARLGRGLVGRLGGRPGGGHAKGGRP